MERNLAQYESTYQSSEFEPVQARMRKRLLLRLLDQYQPRRILEVGCGTDALFGHWPRFDRFVVIEPSQAFASKARQESAEDSRITIIEDLVQNAAPLLAKEDFDMIFVSGLLHEVPDPATILKSLRPLCKTNTFLHVNVPNAKSLHRILALEMGLINSLYQLSDRQNSLQQSHTFDIENLALLCERSGFRVTERGSYFIKPFTHSQMAELQAHGILSERMIDGLYRLESHLPGLGSEIYVHLERSQ